MRNYHLGINLGHDRAAALVGDGELLVAIQQERLDRRKHSVGLLHQAARDPAQVQLPDEAIHYCLTTCGIGFSEVATITANMPGIDHGPEILRRKLPPELGERVRQVPSHHLAHAYSAYWPSGFDEAVVLVADATGSTSANHETESYTLYQMAGEEITTLAARKVPAHLAGISTLGFIYEYICRKAGFITPTGPEVIVPEAGKLMGLAPYGGPQGQWHRWIHPRPRGYELGISAYDIFLEVAALEKRYDDGQGKPYLRPYLVDLAWKVQTELEEALVHLAGLALKESGSRKLCLAGGVALNSVANYKLLRRLELEGLFVFPAAGDAGIAAGCAWWAYATAGRGRKRPVLRRATLGRVPGRETVRQALARFAGRIEVEELTPAQTLTRTAASLARGQIVARFEGGSEYGPRALGHRSILADPVFTRMKDIVNARIKFREPFRPFAPVIPEECLGMVFTEASASPFMLLVAPIKEQFQQLIPGVTHHDGTGRVQTVTAADNPWFHQLCHELTTIRGGPPVLLNTSFNVAGQPIVETPTEAIKTFLRTGIDYLCLEQFWISKTGVAVPDYREHLAQLGESCLPHGLDPGQPAVTALMRQLDRALFFGESEGSPWSEEELRRLSAEGGRFKETSVLFPENPFGRALQTQVAPGVVLLLDPLGKSRLVDLSGRVPSTGHDLAEVRMLLAGLDGSELELESLRASRQLTTLELAEGLEWAKQHWRSFGVFANPRWLAPVLPDSPWPMSNEEALGAFADPNYSARQLLAQLRTVLRRAEYNEERLCRMLEVSSLPLLAPTELHYRDRFALPPTALGDLIRLFQLRVALSVERLQELFPQPLFAGLVRLGVLLPRAGLYASRLELSCADGLLIATDHRYLVMAEDQFAEQPVMYLGLDSLGLVHAAPRPPVARLLDLCTGSGVQALVGSRYALQATGVDINPRALRFARFNAQLNGIGNVTFLQGDLYQAVAGQSFELILANPPFVPSPSRELCFRDGGVRGEELLQRVIGEAGSFLSPGDKLHIVTDLADVEGYEAKLAAWWQGGPAHHLVLRTADRNDLIFSVPHCHAPFAQSLADYNATLAQWVDNFRQEGLGAINFGYILIHKAEEGAMSSYYLKTVENPQTPMHRQVESYFHQLARLASPERERMFLCLDEGIHFRMEFRVKDSERRWELFWPDDPYFTTYVVKETIYRELKAIGRNHPPFAALVNDDNREWIRDLILKGIIRLTWDGPDRGLGILERRRCQRNHTELNDEMAIEELETETTPTCLSSYV